MIALPDSAKSKKGKVCKEINFEESDLESDNESEAFDEESEDANSCSEDYEMDQEEIEPEIENPSSKLLKTWHHLSPPTKEADVLGKWFVGIWSTKKINRICIGRMTKRFLNDEDGKACAIELNYLKPKVGLDTLMEETPEHLQDVAVFNIENIIDGPIMAIPLKNKKWDIPDYDNIFSHFQDVLKIDRLSLKNLSFYYSGIEYMLKLCYTYVKFVFPEFKMFTLIYFKVFQLFYHIPHISFSNL